MLCPHQFTQMYSRLDQEIIHPSSNLTVSCTTNLKTAHNLKKTYHQVCVWLAVTSHLENLSLLTSQVGNAHFWCQKRQIFMHHKSMLWKSCCLQHRPQKHYGKVGPLTWFDVLCMKYYSLILKNSRAWREPITRHSCFSDMTYDNKQKRWLKGSCFTTRLNLFAVTSHFKTHRCVTSQMGVSIWWIDQLWCHKRKDQIMVK